MKTKQDMQRSGIGAKHRAGLKYFGVITTNITQLHVNTPKNQLKRSESLVTKEIKKLNINYTNVQTKDY